ncbi:hypothetical protein A3Q56_04648, partial [Intoshia linei]
HILTNLNRKLSILLTDNNDSGNYSCVDHNDALISLYQLVSKNRLDENNKLTNSGVILLPKYKRAVKGMTVILRCFLLLSTNILSTFKWLINDTPINETDLHYTINGSILIIKDIQLYHFKNNYSCSIDSLSLSNYVKLELIQLPRVVNISVESVNIYQHILHCQIDNVKPMDMVWLKDGNAIDSKNVIIKNPGKMRLNVLDSTSSGIYQCIGKNELALITATFAVYFYDNGYRVPPPKNLVGKALPNRKIYLKWDPVQFAHSYVIQYNAVQRDGSYSDVFEKVEVNSKLVIDTMLSNTSYKIIVHAVNKYGYSEPSREIYITTLKQHDAIRTPTFSVYSQTPTSLNVEWKNVDKVYIDQAKKISIFFKLSTDNSPLSLVNYSLNVHSAVISNLIPGMSYLICLVVSTEIDYTADYVDVDNQCLEHFTIQTPIPLNYPNMINFQISQFNETSVRISWDKSAIDIYKYKKIKILINSLYDESQLYSIYVWDFHKIVTLEPNLVYTIRMCGDFGLCIINSVLYSINSNNIFQSNELQYIYFDVYNITINTASIKWSSYMRDNEVNKYLYTLRYEPIHVDGIVLSQEVAYVQCSCYETTLENLKAETVYSFSIKAEPIDLAQLMWQGNFNSVKYFKTQTGIPSEPTNVDWVPLKSCLVRITWDEPIVTNGKICLYKLKYRVKTDKNWKIISIDGSMKSFDLVLDNNSDNVVILQASTIRGFGKFAKITIHQTYSSGLHLSIICLIAITLLVIIALSTMFVVRKCMKIKMKRCVSEYSLNKKDASNIEAKDKFSQESGYKTDLENSCINMTLSSIVEEDYQCDDKNKICYAGLYHNCPLDTLSLVNLSTKK